MISVLLRIKAKEVGYQKLLHSHSWSLLWVFIKHWCIVGSRTVRLPLAINGSLSIHRCQECNGQTDKVWRPLLMQSHTAEIRLEGPIGVASSMWSEIEEW